MNGLVHKGSGNIQIDFNAYKESPWNDCSNCCMRTGL